jgi:hypothetical protein
MPARDSITAHKVNFQQIKLFVSLRLKRPDRTKVVISVLIIVFLYAFAE